MKKQLYRAAAATVLGLSLTTGVAAAQTPYQYHDHRGHDNGSNSVALTQSSNVSNVGVNNVTNQNSYTGDASVYSISNNRDHHGDHHDYFKSNSSSNNNGGSASTGDASNSNMTSGTISIKQSSPAPAVAPVVDNQGDHHDHGSNNAVAVTQSNNVSNLSVNNVTNQEAVSGDAKVVSNGNGGSASTGDASNSNSTGFNISVNQ